MGRVDKQKIKRVRWLVQGVQQQGEDYIKDEHQLLESRTVNEITKK